MTIAVVDTAAVGATVSTGGYLLNFPSPAGPGDLLVICGCSDATLQVPAGFTLSPGASNVGNSGYYLFWREATGGEASALITTSIGGGPFPTAYAYLRASGVLAGSPFEVAANAANQASGTTFPAAPLTLGGSGELVVGFASASGLLGSAQAPIAWGGGYTARQFAATGTGASDQAVWLATRQGAGPGPESPAPGALATATSNRYLISAAFLPAAGPTTDPRQAAMLAFIP